MYDKRYKGRNRDYNRHHLREAKCWNEQGSTSLPVMFLNDLHRVSSLQRIETSSLLFVSPMSHSRPLLQLPAQEVLDEIAVRFQTELQKKNLSRYRIVLTSGTRSQASQATLQKVNTNAASETAHWYGYTFDIAYDVFIKRYFWEDDVPSPVLLRNWIPFFVECEKKGKYGCWERGDKLVFI